MTAFDIGDILTGDQIRAILTMFGVKVSHIGTSENYIDVYEMPLPTTVSGVLWVYTPPDTAKSPSTQGEPSTMNADYSNFFYVYILCYPDNTPFYVGKGSNGRMSQHVAEYKAHPNDSLKHRVIGDILSAGLRVVETKEVYNLLEKVALQFEKVLIRRLTPTGFLVNHEAASTWSEEAHLQKLEHLVRSSSRRLEPSSVAKE